MKKLLVSVVMGILILGGIPTISNISANATAQHEGTVSNTPVIYRSCPNKNCRTKGAIAPFDFDGIGYKCRTCGHWIG